MTHKSRSKVWWMVGMCVLFAFGASAFGQQATTGYDGSGCTNRTLFGSYGTVIEGTFVANNWSLRTASMMDFDGKGNVTTSDFVVLNGNPLSSDWTSKSGTYSVNPDCTGTFILEGVIKAHFTVTNNGKEIRGVTDGDAITLAGSRVR